MEAIYGEGGRYTALCQTRMGFKVSVLRWLNPDRSACEYVERWESEWLWQRFRVECRAERQRIAEFAQHGIVLSGRVVDRYYERRLRPDDDESFSPA